MKPTLTFVTILLLAGLEPTAIVAQKATPAISLTISLPQAEVKAGSYIQVDVEKKNISSKDLFVGSSVGDVESAYNVIVTGPGGQTPALTAYAQKLRGPHAEDGQRISMITSTLKQGEALKEHFFVNKLYDLTAPGQYIIRVEQTDVPTKLLVKSNTVTFTVVP